MDVIEGRGPSPRLVNVLIQRLPDDSLTSALASGGREFFGWGQDRFLAADTYDAINQTTRAAGRWGKKGPPKIDPFPRPSRKKVAGRRGGDKPTKPVSVADLYKGFQGR